MDDQEDPSIDGISDEQRTVLNVLEICASSLSVIGSATIVFKILHDRAQNGSMNPYDRIMLGLSSCDIFASVTWGIGIFLYPSFTGHPWAFGNLATCQSNGFLTQLSLSAWWYNCILSYYFLLTVLSQVRQKNYVKKWEPWMHLSVIFFPITAILGLLLGWYNATDDTICWITDKVIRWIVAAIPIFFTQLSLIINNIVIYVVVRKSLRASEDVDGLTLVQKRLKREATTLMFLYVAAFFVTVTPLLVRQLFEIYFGSSYYDVKLYPLMVLDSVLRPLQGFFNFFIYIKPMYTRFRVANRDKSMYFVLHQALFNPDVPQINSTSEPIPTNPNQALFSSDFLLPSHSSDSSSSSESSSSSDSS